MSAMSGKRTLNDAKSGMILDQPAAWLLLEPERLEILSRHSSQAKVRIGREPEAAIISGVSKDDAPSATAGTQLREAGFD
jgi:hypothetical protein